MSWSVMEHLDGLARGVAARGKARRRGRRAVLLGAGVALMALPAAPAGAQEQEQEQEQERERSGCYCVSGTPSAEFWTASFGRRARMGVFLESEPDAADASLGARIDRVVRRSPAEDAGLREGDIITAIDGRSVLEPFPSEDIDDDESAAAARVSMIMDDVEPGDTIRVDYLRDGEPRTAQVATRDRFDFDWPGFRATLAPRARAHVQALRHVPTIRLGGAFGFGAEGRFGLQVVDLSPDLGEYFGSDEGVLVLRVDDDSPLELRAGDVIQRVDGRSVEDAAHLREILSTYREDEPVSLEVLRRQQRVTVEGRAP